jgi:hypothetical protein
VGWIEASGADGWAKNGLDEKKEHEILPLYY